MRKLLALLVAAVLVCPAAACAAGFGGLFGQTEAPAGGGIDNLILQSSTWGVVPDPYELLGKRGDIRARDYPYEPGYLCTYFAYPLPKDVDGFVEAYTAEVERNGLAVEQLTVQGADARKIIGADGSYALLVPSFYGETLLLVQNGMPFGRAKPTEYGLGFEFNGKSLKRSYRDLSVIHDTSSGTYSVSAAFPGGLTVESIAMEFPHKFQAGDSYRVVKGSSRKDISLTLRRNGSLTYYYHGNPYIGSKFSDDQDYFEVYILSVEEVDGQQVIHGLFEGSFLSGSIMITNGYFYIPLKR